MLTENQVVDAVCEHLRSKGYIIESFCHSHSHGEDIVAYHPASPGKLSIEAKGGTSNVETSQRYGQPFTNNQLRDHFANAFFTAACKFSAHPEGGFEVGIAMPDLPWCRRLYEKSKLALESIGISVFFVLEGEAMSVTEY